MPLFLYVCLLISLCACSQVNTRSQEYYLENKKMQHGLLPPVSTDKVTAEKNIPINFQAAERGKKIYTNYCMECHGVKGEGNGPKATKLNIFPANLKTVVNRSSQFKFYMKFSQWSGNMPGWKNAFSEKELDDLYHYLKQLAQK